MIVTPSARLLDARRSAEPVAGASPGTAGISGSKIAAKRWMRPAFSGTLTSTVFTPALSVTARPA